MGFTLVRSLALACCLVVPGVAQATSWQGQVSRVTDGDTLTVTDGKRSVVIRLAEIDSPESAQAWGKQAWRALQALVADRTVRVDKADTDRYGRTVAHITVGGMDVSETL